MGDKVTRQDVERAIWQLTDYRGDQVAVDALLAVIDAYKLSDYADEDVAHLLLTMTTQILDTGGRMRLVAAPEPLDVRLSKSDITSLKADTSIPHRTVSTAYREQQKVPVRERNGVSEQFCRLCEQWKPFDQFHADRQAASGRKGRCKACSSAAKAA
jgi:hypothetical protein